MSFLTSLIIICLFIALGTLIMFLVRAKTGTDQNNIVRPMPMWLTAMITSDWHIEPWYSTGGAAKNNWDPSTIDDWSVDAQINCNGVSQGSKRGDTPLGVVQSAIKDFVKGIPKSQRLFFFTGDTFAHGLGSNEPDVGIEKTIMYKIFDKDQGLLKYFEPENIFYTVGNHGAKTDEAFWKKDGVSEVWAQSLIDNGIYELTGTDADDIFMECGYYKKHLPNSTIDIICFNSILYSIVDGHTGCNNCVCQDKQIARLISDLDSLSEGRTVYILSHYPIDSEDAVYKRFIWDKIDKKYQDRISGIFTAHTHTKLTSLNQWESKNGVAHTWNIPSIYWRDNDDVSSYIKVMFPVNTPIVLAQQDVKEVTCENKKTSELVWK